MKHAALRALYVELMTDVFNYAAKYSDVPLVLDLGAGEGEAALAFLELGAKVTAIDISLSQIEAIHRKCERFSERLQLRCQDIKEALKEKGQQYDIIVANSFLHHVPDYVGMIGEAITLLSGQGQFFSFQDPLRYDTSGVFVRAFSNLAYFSWRLFKGDVLGGIKRRIRRSQGIYLADSIYDNAEYHATRNGVDQDAITQVFRSAGFEYNLVRYFSTQSRFFQPVGMLLGIHNTFAIIARKKRGDKNASVGAILSLY
jgi:SAM-dependent methyltransferase